MKNTRTIFLMAFLLGVAHAKVHALKDLNEMSLAELRDYQEDVKTDLAVAERSPTVGDREIKELRALLGRINRQIERLSDTQTKQVISSKGGGRRDDDEEISTIYKRPIVPPVAATSSSSVFPSVKTDSSTQPLDLSTEESPLIEEAQISSSSTAALSGDGSSTSSYKEADEDDDLSAGEIAGIGVGATALGAGLLGGGYLLTRKNGNEDEEERRPLLDEDDSHRYGAGTTSYYESPTQSFNQANEPASTSPTLRERFTQGVTAMQKQVSNAASNIKQRVSEAWNRTSVPAQTATETPNQNSTRSVGKR